MSSNKICMRIDESCQEVKCSWPEFFPNPHVNNPNMRFWPAMCQKNFTIRQGERPLNASSWADNLTRCFIINPNEAVAQQFFPELIYILMTVPVLPNSWWLALILLVSQTLSYVSMTLWICSTLATFLLLVTFIWTRLCILSNLEN